MSKIIYLEFKNTSLKEYLSLFNENDYTYVSYNWSNNKLISKMNKLCKLGYFKKTSFKGNYKYTKTSKIYTSCK